MNPAACVGDALSSINVVGAMADPHDVPSSVQDVLIVDRLISDTTKPLT